MLKLGIIGCGSVMQGPYMELVNKLIFKKIIELKTICDVDKKIEKIVSKKFYYKNFVTDYNKILKDKEIDSVLILTSMNEHAKIAKECLKQNKRVLVEKPMATNLRELNELYTFAKKSKKYLVAAPFVILSTIFFSSLIANPTIGKFSLSYLETVSLLASS